MKNNKDIQPLLPEGHNQSSQDVFNTPEGYFDHLLSDIQDKISSEEKEERIPFFRLFLQPKYAVATILLLLSGIVFATMIYKGVIFDFNQTDPNKVDNTEKIIINDDNKNEAESALVPIDAKKSELKLESSKQNLIENNIVELSPTNNSDQQINESEKLVVFNHQYEIFNFVQQNSGQSTIPIKNIIKSEKSISLCDGESLKINSRSIDKDARYIWSLNKGSHYEESINLNLNYADLKPGVNSIALSLFDEEKANIIGTDTIWITKNNAKDFDLGSDICSEMSIQLKAPSGYEAYRWDDGSLNQIRLIKESGTYKVTAFYGQNLKCSVSDEINIKILPEPIIPIPSDQTICNGKEAYLNTELSDEYQHLWLPSGSMSNQISLDELNTGYNKISLTVNGCKEYNYEYYVQVKPCNLNIPNSFSPNGDGFNDRFIIEGLESFSNHDLIIMNRQGKRVYQSNDYQNDWDAHNLEDGVYFYILRLTFEKDKFEETGTLSIIRKL